MNYQVGDTVRVKETGELCEVRTVKGNVITVWRTSEPKVLKMNGGNEVWEHPIYIFDTTRGNVEPYVDESQLGLFDAEKIAV